MGLEFWYNQDNMKKALKKYFIKIICHHCGILIRGNAQRLMYPKEIICMDCGRTLTGYRRVSKVDGVQKIWIEYRQEGEK